MKLPNNLPDLPEGWDFKGDEYSNKYIWVIYKNGNRCVFCLDKIEGRDTYRVEYITTGWNHPFESFKGYGSIQEAAQVVASLILVRGTELLERAYPGATAHSQEQS